MIWNDFKSEAQLRNYNTPQLLIDSTVLLVRSSLFFCILEISYKNTENYWKMAEIVFLYYYYF